MRKKSITLLVCVYAALCISYSVVSSAIVPNNDDVSQLLSQETSKISSQSNLSDSSSDTAAKKPSLSETVSSSAASKSESSKAVNSNTTSDENDNETEHIETSDNSLYESESSSADTGFYSEESITSDNEVEEQDLQPDIGTDTPEEITETYVSEDESQEQIEDEDEYQEEKPSLADYLSGLRCSGCRHNCSLLSPRCMNGARKANQAESQYYQIYGA